MTITGTLMHRPARAGWTLHLDNGYYDLVDGPDPAAITSVEVLLALGEALKPIITREKLHDMQLSVRQSDGLSIGALIVRDGVIAPVPARGGGVGAPR